MWELQQAIQISEQWAIDFGTKCTLARGKSQLLLLQGRAARYKRFQFAEGQIQTVREASYLGVEITSGAALEDTTIKRIQNAHTIWTQLRTARLVCSGIDPKYACMIFRSLVQSGIDYGCFLSP